MKCINVKETNVIISKPTLGNDETFFSSIVVNDLNKFKRMSNTIVASRNDNSYVDVKSKIYTVGLFRSD